ncbi:peptidylprolyl isomerase [Paenibacillus sp. GCM10012307]|uniref:Foldase protein PrsA n=1 Tax=Paenibacillus roseus TaxID=2798579 RepID=A0A934MRT0_9BACL|nr:peptidylprolyl isomerase [Paenibacillus roseus]MBJ6362634.1 peptidylprolyl isomerase [Paenibacillus roseus]
MKEPEDKKLDESLTEADKEEGTTEAKEESAETAETALDDDVSDKDESDEDERRESEELPDAVLADHAGQEPQAPNKPNRLAAVWMGVSFVLLVLLIVIAVTGPLGGKASNEVVAVVNGEEITKNDLYNTLVDAGGKQTLDSLITEKLLSQEMAKAGLAVTDADIDQEWQKLEEQYGSKEQLLSIVEQNGMTEDILRKQIHHQIELRKLLAPTVEVTEDKIKEYYEQNKEYMGTPEQVRASHILVATEKEAEEILAELKQGADFATLAKEKSTDPGSKENGGDLNFFGRGAMMPEFEEAAFALKKDELSDIVKTTYGFHIIKVTDRKEAVSPSYEEKKDELKEQLVNNEVYTKSTTWLQELRDKSTIDNKLNPEQPSTQGQPAEGSNKDEAANSGKNK